MDLELYKMLLTVINQVIDKLPVGMSGMIVTVALGYVLHKSKIVPYKIIKEGVNGHTTVTADDLKTHCKVAHEPLIDSLKVLTDNQRVIQNDIILIRETTSYIKGQLSERVK